MSDKKIDWKYYACPICEACCGLRIHVDEQSRQILRIEGDKDVKLHLKLTHYLPSLVPVAASRDLAEALTESEPDNTHAD